MAWGKKRSEGGGCAANVALILAILALILAWTAYRRTGGDLDGLIRDVTGRVPGPEAAEWQGELARARSRLLEWRPEVAADENLGQVRRDVTELRESLERAYEDAGAGARKTWRDVDAELERLEARLREGGSEAVESLDAAAEKMRIGEDEGGDGEDRR